MTNDCQLCRTPLPQVPWWRQLLTRPSLIHDLDGPKGDACWAIFNARLGIIDPDPKPSRESVSL